MRGTTLVGIVMTLGLVLGACGGGTATRSPAPAAPATSAPSASEPRAAPGTGTTLAPPPKAVKVAYGFLSTSALPLWVGEDQGLYEKHGPRPETIYLQSSAQIAPAMVSGEVEIALTAVYGVVEIDLAGGDQVILASVTNYMPFVLHARPEIRRIEDLRGQQLAVTALAAGSAWPPTCSSSAPG